jgi:hypothetical protein
MWTELVQKTNLGQTTQLLQFDTHVQPFMPITVWTNCNAELVICRDNQCSMRAVVLPHVGASVLDFGKIQGYGCSCGWNVLCPYPGECLWNKFGQEISISAYVIHAHILMPIPFGRM